jgi:hypothetical protein
MFSLSSHSCYLYQQPRLTLVLVTARQDTNGFVYYLGTNEGKSVFANPTSVGNPPNVRVNVPGMNSGSGYNGTISVVFCVFAVVW